jgi:MinD superfamily P-loop ATPase
MVHAQLGPAQGNSGKLVSLLRKQAKKIAHEQKINLIIVDGSPGIGCPVIASITGADLVLIITEPTLTALHDMERAVKLTRHFGIPTALCINKFDINSQITKNIQKSATRSKLPLLGKIRLDNTITKAQLVEKSVVEFADNTTSGQIIKMWKSVLKFMQKKGYR